MSVSIEQKPSIAREFYSSAAPGAEQNHYPTGKLADRAFSRRGGRLVSKLIAERRFGKHSDGHTSRVAKIAEALSGYQGILPDPVNQARRLKVTRLIASIDQGSLPSMYDRIISRTKQDEQHEKAIAEKAQAERAVRELIVHSAPLTVPDQVHANGKNGTNGHAEQLVPMPVPSRPAAAIQL